jgi:hypothetical protein
MVPKGGQAWPRSQDDYCTTLVTYVQIILFLEMLNFLNIFIFPSQKTTFFCEGK